MESEAVLTRYRHEDGPVNVLLCRYRFLQDARDAYIGFCRDYLKAQPGVIEPLLIEKLENEKYSGILLKKNFVVMAFDAGHRDVCEHFIWKVINKSQEIYR